MFGIRCLILIAFIFVNCAAQLSLRAHKSVIESRIRSSGLECLKDYALSNEDMKVLRSENLPEGMDAKCFVGCVFKTFGIMDDAGKVSVEGATNTAKSIFGNGEEFIAKAEEIVKTCSTVNDMEVEMGENESCERAKLIFHCLKENKPELGVTFKL